jgi:hypothetical protein
MQGNMYRKAEREFRELRENSLKTIKACAIKEHAMCLWHYESRIWAIKQWMNGIPGLWIQRLYQFN